MNSRRLDRADGADRSGELAFERTAVVDPLLKLGGAEVRLVEKLESDTSTPRQSGAGKLEA
jgi:hypothetical protein